MSEWNWDNDYRHAWSETDDPRVFAVITLDDDRLATDLLDICGLDPVILGYGHGYRADLTIVNHWHGAGNTCAEMYILAERFVRALEHFGDGERLDRWTRLYLGRVPVFVSSSVDRYSWAVVLLTPEDAAKHAVSEDATVAAVRAVLDGEVFGVGAAVLPDRVAPRDVEAAEVIDAAEMECWGYAGEEYAKGEALEFANWAAEHLPEFLPLN